MALLDFPTLSSMRHAPPDVEIGLRSNTAVFVSDLSGQAQTVELPGARWSLSFGYGNLQRDDAALMEAFLVALRGQANRARVLVFGREAPRGTWAGSPLVDGAGQTGASLLIKGFSAGATVKKGDYFNVGANGELKMVSADGTATGGGALTISFEPPLRASPANNTALVSANCVIPRMILNDSHPRWQHKPAGFSDFSLDFVEVFT